MNKLSMAAKAAAVLAVAGALSTAQAQGLKPLLGASITAGGETLATVVFTDGSTQKVKSGGLVHLFGGLEYQGASWALQANVGYHVDDTNAKNGSVKFARVPVEVLAFWKASDTFKLGGGVRKAGSAKVTSSGAASNIGSINLDSKLGVVLQGEYFFTADKASVLFRYVSEDYKVNGVSISGKHAGVGLAYRF